MTDALLLTDAEICDLLGISKSTIRRQQREGPPRKRYANAGDIRLIRAAMIGGQRRWCRKSVEAFVNGD